MSDAEIMLVVFPTLNLIGLIWFVRALIKATKD